MEKLPVQNKQDSCVSILSCFPLSMKRVAVLGNSDWCRPPSVFLCKEF